MKKTSGFTIVELLIVIVVIAILAAISVVAYNGIQQRARQSSLASQTSQTEKEIMAWALQKNGESVSLSNTLVGYQLDPGSSQLLRPLVGTPDITMYAVYQVTDRSTAYMSYSILTPIAAGQRFALDTEAANNDSLRYRIDTSAQTNLVRNQSAIRNPGTRVIGWLQVSNGATARAFGYNRSAPTATDLISSHAGWNFTGVSSGTDASGTTPLVLVFSSAHDQTTRAQVLGWLAEKYGVSGVSL